MNLPRFWLGNHCCRSRRGELRIPTPFAVKQSQLTSAPTLLKLRCAERSTRAQGPGFTLIELLVVIAILAVLAAFIFPALSAAKAKAHRIDCLSREKQWAEAFLIYAEEHDGSIAREGYEPFGEVLLNNWSQVRGRPLPEGGRDSDDVWYNALSPYLSQPPAADFASPANRAQFYDKRHLIHCPSARFPDHAFRPSFQFALFSLAMNSQLIQYGQGPTINLTLIEQRDTSRIALFLDNLLEEEEKVHPAQESTFLGQPSAYANRFSARHGRGGNLAFADGHAAWLPGNKVVETNDKSPLRGGPILPPKEVIWDLYTY